VAGSFLGAMSDQGGNGGNGTASDKEAWGIVLVDLRPPKSPLYHRIAIVLKRLAAISPAVAIELWVSPHMILPQNFSVQFAALTKLHVKRLTLPDPELAISGTRTKYGYISKAYALQQSSFQTALFFDSDVYFCENWERGVDASLAQFKESKVLWTIEKDPYADFWARNNSQYVSPELAPELHLYREYPERNTGSIVGIRKSPESALFLNHTIRLWHGHRKPQLMSDGHPRAISGTDQGAFREASFLDRSIIKQAILDDEIFCRGPNLAKHRGEDYFYGGGPNDCNCNLCSIVHYANFFEKCTHNISFSVRL
jgi:hypothetical protein